MKSPLNMRCPIYRWYYASALVVAAVVFSAAGCASPLTSTEARSKTDSTTSANRSKASAKSAANRSRSSFLPQASTRTVTDFVTKPFKTASKPKRKAISGDTNIPKAADVGLQRRGD